MTFSVLESLKALGMVSRFKDSTEPSIKDKFELSLSKYAIVVLSKNVQPLQQWVRHHPALTRKKTAQIKI